MMMAQNPLHDPTTALRLVINGLNEYGRELDGESAEAAAITAAALNREYDNWQRELDVADQLVKNADGIMGSLNRLLEEHAEVLGAELAAEMADTLSQMKDVRDALAAPVELSALPPAEEYFAGKTGFQPWRSATQMLAELTEDATDPTLESDAAKEARNG